MCIKEFSQLHFVPLMEAHSPMEAYAPYAPSRETLKGLLLRSVICNMVGNVPAR